LGILLAALLIPSLLAAAILVGFGPAGASSHREAPLISSDPAADNTDTYVFVPPNAPNNVVLAANWIPFESPEGGPNYYEFNDNVLYDIYVDNNGDAIPDFTYTLSSKTTITNPDTFLYNTGPIGSLNDPNWNRRQVYSVTETTAAGVKTVLVNGVSAPPVNIGSKSTPNYAALANAATYTVNQGSDTIKIFAGQRDDPFWVDLQVFDLLTLRGHPAPIGYKNFNVPVDALAGYNVHSLVLELPISRLARPGDPVLGVWSGSRRASMTVLNGPAAPAQYTRVSRLGMPLVNEVVIPMSLKDAFNTLQPEQDLSLYGVLQKSVEDPEIGTLLCSLYGIKLPGAPTGTCHTPFTAGTPRTGRGDIFDIFLTGMKLAKPFTINTAGGPVTLPAGTNVNQPNGGMNVQPSEMIRINTALKGSLCSPTPNRLGVVGGDACGFPNGRRLTDDAVEIELLAVAGAAYPALDGRDAAFSFDPKLVKVLTDNVDRNDKRFLSTFPYLALPHSGQSRLHQNPILIDLLLRGAQEANSAATAAQQAPVQVSLAGVTFVALGLFWLRRRRNNTH
jgi:hypothetical protein